MGEVMSNLLDVKTAIYIQHCVDDTVTRALAEREREFFAQKAFCVGEAARILGLSVSTIRQLIWSGAIPHIRLNRVVRVPKSAIDALLANTVRT